MGTKNIKTLLETFHTKDENTRPGSIKYGLSTPYRLAFHNGPRMIDDVLLEHGGLNHVLPLSVHLNCKVERTILKNFFY